MQYLKKLRKIKQHIKLLFIPFEDNDYRPEFLQSNLLVSVVVVLLLVKIVSIGFFMPFAKNFFFADITKIDLVHFLNQDRQNKGLPTLTDNPALDQVAMAKAQDMVAKSYFAHTSPEGKTPWFWFKKIGYDYKYAGENLAVGFVNSSEVFDAWINSPSHRANVLNPNYTQVGTAVVSGFGDANAMVVVQVFGSLQPKAPVATAKPPVAVVAQEKPKIPEPTQIAQNENTESAVVKNEPETFGPEVLGNATISQLPDAPVLPNAAYANLMHFLMYQSNVLVAYVSYGFLLLLIGLLLLNIFVNVNVWRGQLIARAIVLIIILCGMTFLDQNVISGIIPHQLII